MQSVEFGFYFKINNTFKALGAKINDPFHRLRPFW